MTEPQGIAAFFGDEVTTALGFEAKNRTGEYGAPMLLE